MVTEVMLPLMWVFRSSAVVLAYIAMNIYTGIRVLVLLRYFLPTLKAFVFWLPYILFCNSLVLVNLLRLDRVYFLRQVSLYSLPAIVYLFLGLLVFDAVVIVLRILKHNLSRGFFAVGTGIALGFAVLILIYGFFNARYIRTVNYEISLNKGKAGSQNRMTGLRAAIVSDLHIGRTVERKWLVKVVNAINETRPDIILIAGDIFDNNISALKDPEGIMAEFSRLSAPMGVYACPGNHDIDRLSLSAAAATDRIKEFLKSAGIILLQDEVIPVNDAFYLIGRRDARPIGARQARKSAAELSADLDKSRPLIFLDHQPVDFPAEEEAGADLIFSGHTHRGQFFPGNIVTAYIYRKAGAVHYGHWRGISAQGVVSSGAGVWGPPFRIATNSEVAVVDIEF